jgi:hypothetical protein
MSATGFQALFLYDMSPPEVQKLDEVFMRQALALARL